MVGRRFVVMLAAASREDSPLWGIVAVMVMGVTMLIWAFWHGERTTANLRMLAQRLGLAVTPKMLIPGLERAGSPLVLWGGLPQEMGVAGERQGRAVRFSTYSVPRGKGRAAWAELAVSAKTNAFTFALRPESWSHKLLEKLGEREIKTGDDTFDRRWELSSNGEEPLRALLLPELRAKMDQQASATGQFRLENGWLRYGESGDFSDLNQVARFENLLGLMGELALAAEVAAEKFSPPPTPVYDDPKEEVGGEKSPEWRGD